MPTPQEQAQFESNFFVTVALDGTADFNCDDKNAANQIQAALDSLPSTGGTVYLKTGVYTIGRTILMDPFKRIIGAGTMATTLRAKDNLNADMFQTRVN